MTDGILSHLQPLIFIAFRQTRTDPQAIANQITDSLFHQIADRRRRPRCRPRHILHQIGSAPQRSIGEMPHRQSPGGSLRGNRMKRQNRAAITLRDETFDVGVTIHFEHGLGAKPGTQKHFVQHRAKTVRLARQDQLLLFEKSNGHGRTGTTLRRHQQDKLLLQQSLRRYPALMQIGINNRQVDPPLQQPVPDKTAHRLGNDDLDSRIEVSGTGDEGHGQNFADRAGQAKPDGAARLAAETANGLFRLRQIGQYGTRPGREQFALLCGNHACGPADQQRRAQSFLHPPDVKRQSRLRDTQTLRCPRERPFFNDGQKIPKSPDIHTVSSIQKRYAI